MPPVLPFAPPCSSAPPSDSSSPSTASIGSSTAASSPSAAFSTPSTSRFGVAVAWLITVSRSWVARCSCLGCSVRPLCAWFAVELTVGIVLVHARDGWFVVGGGRNGMEYSLLLIVGLIVTAMLDAARKETPVTS